MCKFKTFCPQTHFLWAPWKKNLGQFLLTKCLYRKYVSSVLGIKPGPHIQTTNGQMLIWGILCRFKCSQTSHIYHWSIWAFHIIHTPHGRLFLHRGICIKGTRGGKSRRPEVVAVILNCCGTCWYFNSNDNKTALLKSVLKTVMDPPWVLLDQELHNTYLFYCIFC